MVLNLQRRSELKTQKDRKLYDNVLEKIHDQIFQVTMNPRKNLNSDRQRQHKLRISKLVINGKVNPLVTSWLKNTTKGDIVTFDDVPKDLIKRLRHGDNLKTKSERKLLSRLRKISHARSEKQLIKDLSGNETLVDLKNYNKWIKNKTKYDIKGVDTIPKAVASFTSSKVNRKYNTTSKGILKKYSRQPASKGGHYSRTMDSFTGMVKSRRIKINRLMKGSPESHRVIAHEVGHSYDWYKYKMTKPSQEVIKAMKTLASIANAPPIPFKDWEKMTPLEKKNTPKSLQKFMKYRLSHKELFADSFSLLMYDVDLAKKKGLSFYNYIIKRDQRLKKLFTQSKLKIVTNIVKGIKKDKKYLAIERNKAKVLILKKQLTKLQNRKRIGLKTKLQITTIQNKIKELKTSSIKTKIIKKPIVKKKVIKKPLSNVEIYKIVLKAIHKVESDELIRDWYELKPKDIMSMAKIIHKKGVIIIPRELNKKFSKVYQSDLIAELMRSALLHIRLPQTKKKESGWLEKSKRMKQLGFK